MERIKKAISLMGKGLCRIAGSRVVAAVLMCTVTLSMVMSVSSHSRVYTVTDGDMSRVVITLSDTPALNLDGGDTLWVNAEAEEEEDCLSVEITADGFSTLVQVTDESTTVADAIQQAGVTVGKLDQVSQDTDAVVTDGMLVQVDRVVYEDYTVTKSVSYKTSYQYTSVLKPNQTRVDVSGRNGEITMTYRKSYVNGELVSDEKIGEEVTKQVRDQVILKGASYGTPLSKTPDGVDIRLDAKNQPLEYSRVISGRCTGYHCGTVTSTGRKPQVGVVAVNPKQIPYGSVLWIVSADGKFVYGYAIAGDTGGFARHGKIISDLYMPSLSEAIAFGNRNLNVYVIKEGNGK